MGNLRHATITVRPVGDRVGLCWSGLGREALTSGVTLTEAWWSETERLFGGFLDAPAGGDPDALLDLALRLTRVLLRGTFRRSFAAALASLVPGDHLSIVLRVDPDGEDPATAQRLCALPWELLRHQRGYLLGDPRVSLLRATGTDDEPDEPATGSNGPLRVLVVTGPRAVPGEAVAAASTVHRRLLRRAEEARRIHLAEELVSPDIEQLSDVLDTGCGDGTPFDLVVFEGHGDPRGVWLQHKGVPTLVPPPRFAEALNGRTRAVLLAACWGGTSLRWTGTAEALARSDIATIACQTQLEQSPVTDMIATVVTDLSLGRTVGEACASARGSLATGHGLAHQARLVIWQPGKDPVRLRDPDPAVITGPRTEVSDTRSGTPDWFIDRPELIGELVDHLDDPQVRLVEVVGGPGTGKSSLLRWWWQQGGQPRLPSPAVALLRDPVLIEARRLSARLLCERVGAAVAARNGDMDELANDLDRTRLLPATELWESLISPRFAEATTKGRTDRLIVLVDELDQADFEFLQFLDQAMEASPDWVTWVCTSRPDIAHLGRFGDKERRSLRLTSHQDDSAVEQFARRRLADDDRLHWSTVEALAARIASPAHGVFLWARVVCDFVLGHPDPADATADELIDQLRLPAAGGNDLTALYHHAFLGSPAPAWPPIAALVRLLAICRNPAGFTASELMAFLPTDGDPVTESLNRAPLGQFLERDGDRFRLFHQSLIDWVLTATPDAAVRAAETHARLGLALDGLRRDGRLGDLASYATDHLIEHLTAALEHLPTHHRSVPELNNTLEGVVNDAAWIVDCVTTRGPAAVARDLRHVSRWVDTGEQQEVLLHTAVDVEADHGSETWMLTALNHQAVIWDEPNLETESAARLDNIGGQWWELVMHRGSRHRAGTAINTAHISGVSCVAWHPTRNLIASGDNRGGVVIWNPDTDQTTTIEAHDRRVQSVAWSPDGTRLATASSDKTVRVWWPDQPDRPDNGTTIGSHNYWVLSVVWSPDGTRIATGSKDKTVRVWWPDQPDHPANGTTIAIHNSFVTSVAWSPDGTRIATGSWDRTVRVWWPDQPDRPDNGTTIGTHNGWVQSVAWSPDGTRLATAGQDGTVRLWLPDHPNRSSDGDIVAKHSSRVQSVAWSPDGTRLATASGLEVRVWWPDQPDHPGSGTTIAYHNSGVASAMWSPDGTRLATASKDDTVRLWLPDHPNRSSDGDIVAKHSSRVQSVAWSPDGTRLATASGLEVRVWWPDQPDHPGDGDIVATHNDPVTFVVWSPDGTRLATASKDGMVRVWWPDQPDHSDNGTAIAYHNSGVTSAMWSPDGTRIATASKDDTVRFWLPDHPNRSSDGDIVAKHSSRVGSVAWSPDGTRLATASGLEVRVWWPDEPDHPGDGDIVATHNDPVTFVVWSPDGTRLATGSSDRMVRVWWPDQPDLSDNGTAIAYHNSGVASAVWSPDGTRLATASSDRMVRLWWPDQPDHPANGTTIAYHGSGVASVAWSPDGTRIATGSYGGSIQVFEQRQSPGAVSFETGTGTSTSGDGIRP